MKKESSTGIAKSAGGESSYKLQVFSKDIKYLKLKDCKRAYSKLIMDWMRGAIGNDDAKTLAYLLTGYIQSVKGYEIELRINKLESEVKAIDFR